MATLSLGSLVGVALVAGAVWSGQRLLVGETTWPPETLLAVGLPCLVAAAALSVGAFLVGFGDPLIATSPATGFEHTSHPDNDTMTLRHDGGDRLDATLLVTVNGAHEGVRLDGNRTVENGHWLAEPPGRPAAAETVSAGDRVLVHGVEPGDSVRVFWRSRADCERSTLGLVRSAGDSERPRLHGWNITGQFSPRN